MAQSGYADTIVNSMLSWLKGFANWVLKLFNLAGKSNVSPLEWLSENWIQLVIFLVIAGVILDWLIWFIRWRPHWVWFGKKRIIVEDEDFFAGEKLVDSGMYDPEIFDIEQDIIEAERRQRPAPERRRPRPVSQNTAVRREARRPRPVSQETRPRRPSHPRRASGHSRDIFEQEGLLRIDEKAAPARRLREDDVFNVANLPGTRRQRPAGKRRPILIAREETPENDDLFNVE